MNKEVIAINQDVAGRQPFFANAHYTKLEPRKNRQPDEPFCENYPLDTPIIAKFLDNGDIAVGIFNFTETPTDHIAASIPLDQFGIFPDSGKTLKWKDLWTGETGAATNGVFYLPTCEPHSCRMFRAKVVNAK